MLTQGLEIHGSQSFDRFIVTVNEPISCMNAEMNTDRDTWSFYGRTCSYSRLILASCWLLLRGCFYAVPQESSKDVIASRYLVCIEVKTRAHPLLATFRLPDGCLRKAVRGVNRKMPPGFFLDKSSRTESAHLKSHPSTRTEVFESLQNIGVHMFSYCSSIAELGQLVDKNAANRQLLAKNVCHSSIRFTSMNLCNSVWSVSGQISHTGIAKRQAGEIIYPDVMLVYSMH